MANPPGIFDQTIIAQGWFDETIVAIGWFDGDFIDAGAAAAAEGSGVGTAATDGAGQGYALHYGYGAGAAASGGAGEGYNLHYGSGAGTAVTGGAGEGEAPTGVSEGSGVGTAASGGAGEGYALHSGSGTGEAVTGGAGVGENGESAVPDAGGGGADGFTDDQSGWRKPKWVREREQIEAAAATKIAEKPVGPADEGEAYADSARVADALTAGLERALPQAPAIAQIAQQEVAAAAPAMELERARIAAKVRQQRELEEIMTVLLMAA